MRIAGDGLASVHARMQAARPGDEDAPLGWLLDGGASRRLDTVVRMGTGDPERELILLYRGQDLRGGRAARPARRLGGSGRFGIEVVEPAIANALMAALLAHDLHTAGGSRHDHPWQDEAHAAAHGGLWRGPYTSRSALGPEALLGMGPTRA